MVRNTSRSVRDLSSSEQVVKYVQEDGAALSPNSKDSLWSNEAINGNLKRSKKLQSVLIRMSRGAGDEQHEETRELHVYKNKSRTVEQRDGMEEFREDDFDQRSLSTSGGLTAGQEQEQERAAIRDHFFHAPAHIAPAGAAETSPKKKKVVTSPSRQQRPLSPRSRTRLSQQTRRNTDDSLSPNRGRRRRRNNSVSPRRKIKPQPMEFFDMDRPGTPKRTGRNSSPPKRLSQNAVNGTTRATTGDNNKAPKRTNGLPDEDDGSSDEGVDFLKAQYRQRKTYDHSDLVVKTKFAQSPKRMTTINRATNQAATMSDTDDNSVGESTLDSSSSDYDSSTTGSFSVDRVRSRQRKMQRANKKKAVTDKGAASRKKRPESSPKDNDEPPFIDLNIASAATDFVSQIMGQMNFPQPFLFPTSPTKEQKQSQNQKQLGAGKEYDLVRPSQDAGDMTSSIFGLFSWDDSKKVSAFKDVSHNKESPCASNNSPKKLFGRVAGVPFQVGIANNNNGEDHDEDWTVDNSVVTDNSILATVGSPKKDLIDEKKISEVIKNAVRSPYDDSDGSMTTVSTNQGSAVSLHSEDKKHEQQQRDMKKDVDDGGSLTYSLEDTVSAQGIEIKPKKNTAALSQSKSEKGKNNEEKTKEKVNGLVAKFEHDMRLAKTGNRAAMNTLHEDKAKSINLTLALSVSADDSLVSEEDEVYAQTPNAGPQGGPTDCSVPKVDRIELARHNTTKAIGRPVIPPNHKHELEAKIKESYERRLKKAAGKVGHQAVNASVSRSVNVPTKSVIPPDAPITTKKVAVNYIHALSKQLGAQSAYANGYVEAIAKTNWAGLKKAQPTIDAAIPKANKNEMDDLVSKIDVVIQRLIESGKLPDGNVAGSGDLQQRNNTAELLQNLAILRARRSSGAVSHQPQQMQQPSTSLSSPKYATTPTLKKLTKTERPEPFVDQSNQQDVKISEPVKQESPGKPSNNSAPVGLSNLARIRARRDEAAMCIKIQTQKLAGLQTDDFPSSFQVSSFPGLQAFDSRPSALAGDSSRSRSRPRGGPPRPEDGPAPRPMTPNVSSPNRFERQRDVFSHLSSTRDPSIMRSISVDDSADTPLLLQRAAPSTMQRSKSAPRTSMGSNASLVTKLGMSVHASESMEQQFLLRNSNHNQQCRTSLPATASDMDMQEWESAELNKLPLILNPSRGEGGSRDEFEQQSWHEQRRADVGASGTRYGSYQARNIEEDETTYADENDDEDEDTATDGTDYTDDFDTDSDSDDDTDTQGSESDGERLERIALMVSELRSRRYAKSKRR